MNFTKHRMLRRWVKEYRHQSTLNTKVKFFKLRWHVLKKKIVLKRLRLVSIKQHIQDKMFTKVSAMLRLKMLHRSMSIWREKF